LVSRLEQDGHAVILGVRDVAASSKCWPGRRHVALDYAAPGDVLDPAAHALDGVDVVINAVGIFRPSGLASFDAVHVKGPCNLFGLAAKAGVRRVVQISALGAEPQAVTAYLRTKAAGDACAAAYPGRSVIVRPSLVFAPGGTSSRVFLRLAALPWLPLPGGGKQCVQPLHLDDLVEGVARLVQQDAPITAVDAVGPTPLTFGGYLQILGKHMGARPRVLTLPDGITNLAARVLGGMGGNLLTPDALAMLRQGSCADPSPWRGWVGRPLRMPGQFIAHDEAQGLRSEAELSNLLPLLRATLSLMWLVTAWVSVFVYPREASLALLERSLVPDTLAPWALMGAAALDAALGLGMWVRPWRRVVYRMQLALIAFYTVVISIALPEFWAHPYGPVLKNVPLLALIYAMLRLEDRNGTGHR
jgi:nucleoside-diphosphate-sugar epimerase